MINKKGLNSTMQKYKIMWNIRNLAFEKIFNSMLSFLTKANINKKSQSIRIDEYKNLEEEKVKINSKINEL